MRSSKTFEERTLLLLVLCWWWYHRNDYIPWTCTLKGKFTTSV